MDANKINNIIMFFFFLAVASTGLLLKYGTRGNGLHYYWQNIHVFTAGVLIVLVVFHWIFHSYWFKKIFRK
jgi:hypothetical protein